MKEQPPQVFGIGQCCLDYIGKIEKYPPPDVKCEFFDMSIQGGGVVATSLVALARWGIACAFTGVIGDDVFGPMIKASLDDEGIDTSGMLTKTLILQHGLQQWSAVNWVDGREYR